MKRYVPKALIVADTHEPESEFGQKVIKDFRRRYDLKNVVYHVVQNNKGSRGELSASKMTETERKECLIANKIAFAEIVDVIKKQNPQDLIDIHCTEYYIEKYVASIIAKDNSRLKHLANATWFEHLSIGGRNGTIYVYDESIGNSEILPDFIKFHPTLNHIELETYLDEKHNHPDYDKEVKFTSKLIKTIINSERG